MGKGNWQYPFTSNVSETFTDDKNEQIKIDMMVTDEFNVKKYNDSEVEVIELPLTMISVTFLLL